MGADASVSSVSIAAVPAVGPVASAPAVCYSDKIIAIGHVEFGRNGVKLYWRDDSYNRGWDDGSDPAEYGVISLEDVSDELRTALITFAVERSLLQDQYNRQLPHPNHRR
jgi:hypothetical protein